VVANLSRRRETALGSKLGSAVSLLDGCDAAEWVHCGNGVAVLGRKELFPPGHHKSDRPAAKGARPMGLAVRMDDQLYRSPGLHGYALALDVP
jgi:hypothetical protein